ncbi:hypothetical protein [Chitinophaga eiseniae]|uniref:Uncharacterized protein n=1 Tax=Chitinophaga eiseniae TaxID=634771 RepID=A0A847SKW4_9BACT|nr:hypothetical protein [Chitinophaga eiseniae]NLR77779.1 hypothetical protein [Chitinophaga eiseniae]
MTFENLRLYDILRLDLHLPDNRAMEAMVAMDDFFSQKVANANRDLPTKAEVATKAELESTKNELKADISAINLKMATKTELESTKNELKADISAINLRLDDMTERMVTKVELNEKLDHMTETMATKAEVNARFDYLTETMATKAEVNARFDHMTELMTTKMATKAELSQVNLNLTGEIYKVETKLTRTIFSASLAQLLVILISIFTILKYAGVIK